MQPRRRSFRSDYTDSLVYMNLVCRFTGAALLIAFIPALAGCSEGRELRTSGQAGSFVVAVAGGESSGAWKLASKPTAEAAQAWADRATISDLGRRLRLYVRGWTC